jgi:tryptophan-rich sensory protein
MKKSASALIAAVAVGACAVAGSLNGPQQPPAGIWYLTLRKPNHTPAGPVIGLTWLMLEGLLAVTGFRLLQSPPSQSRVAALSAWALTLLGLAGFPFTFFRKRRLGAATATAGAMLAAATTSAIAARKVDVQSAVLSIPLIAWLAFATVLNAELRLRNPSRSND